MLIIVSGSVYAAIQDSNLYLAGESFRDAMAEKASDDTVLAMYKDHEILASVVEYNKSLNILRDEESAKEYGTDRQTIDNIIVSIMLVEEAEKRGLGATEEEIAEMVSDAKKTYEIPEGKEILDQYCKGAGITIEEYFKIVEEQAPRIISRQKLRDAIGQEFCNENGIKFTKNNPPPEIQKAVDEYILELFEENKDNIKYFID